MNNIQVIIVQILRFQCIQVIGRLNWTVLHIQTYDENLVQVAILNQIITHKKSDANIMQCNWFTFLYLESTRIKRF